MKLITEYIKEFYTLVFNKSFVDYYKDIDKYNKNNFYWEDRDTLRFGINKIDLNDIIFVIDNNINIQDYLNWNNELEYRYERKDDFGNEWYINLETYILNNKK
jgi:hypothetical protein